MMEQMSALQFRPFMPSKNITPKMFGKIEARLESEIEKNDLASDNTTSEVNQVKGDAFVKGDTLVKGDTIAKVDTIVQTTQAQANIPYQNQSAIPGGYCQSQVQLPWSSTYMQSVPVMGEVSYCPIIPPVYPPTTCQYMNQQYMPYTGPPPGFNQNPSHICAPPGFSQGYLCSNTQNVPTSACRTRSLPQPVSDSQQSQYNSRKGLTAVKTNRYRPEGLQRISESGEHKYDDMSTADMIEDDMPELGDIKQMKYKQRSNEHTSEETRNNVKGTKQISNECMIDTVREKFERLVTSDRDFQKEVKIIENTLAPTVSENILEDFPGRRDEVSDSTDDRTNVTKVKVPCSYVGVNDFPEEQHSHSERLKVEPLSANTLNDLLKKGKEVLKPLRRPMVSSSITNSVKVAAEAGKADTRVNAIKVKQTPPDEPKHDQIQEAKVFNDKSNTAEVPVKVGNGTDKDSLWKPDLLDFSTIRAPTLRDVVRRNSSTERNRDTVRAQADWCKGYLEKTVLKHNIEHGKEESRTEVDNVKVERDKENNTAGVDAKAYNATSNGFKKLPSASVCDRSDRRKFDAEGQRKQTVDNKENWDAECYNQGVSTETVRDQTGYLESAQTKSTVPQSITQEPAALGNTTSKYLNNYNSASDVSVNESTATFPVAAKDKMTSAQAFGKCPKQHQRYKRVFIFILHKGDLKTNEAIT